MSDNTPTGRPQRSRAASRASQRRQTDPDTFDARTRLSPDLRAIDGGISDLDMEDDAVSSMNNSNISRYASGDASGNAGGYAPGSVSGNAAGGAPVNDSSAAGGAAGSGNARNANSSPNSGGVNPAGSPQGTERGGSASRGQKRPVRRGRMGYFPKEAALALLFAGIVLGALVTFGVTKAGEEKRIRKAVEERSDETRMNQMRESLSEGTSVMTTLRKAYTDELVMYKDNKYIFLPIDRELKLHDFHSENVTELSSGEWKYTEGKKVISRKGIDVSSHQGDIDWKKVASDGVEYAIVRAMYRGYGSGKLVEDEKFKDNANGAVENGITLGAYVFTQAITRKEVEEEVEMLKKLLEPYEIGGPVVVDVEKTAEGDGRMDNIDPKLRTELVGYFCELVKEAGYRPMIYFNIETALLMLDLKELEPYEKWFATYNHDFYYPYAYSVWQYTDKGRVDGIDGDVDLDLIF